MAMLMAVCVNFSEDKKPFCRERLLRVDEDATSRCCGLRFEATCLWIPRFAFLIQRLGDAGEDHRHVI